MPVDEPTALVVTDLLLAHGADASVRASDGSTAADHARALGMQAVARRLAPG